MTHARTQNISANEDIGFAGCHARRDTTPARGTRRRISNRRHAAPTSCLACCGKPCTAPGYWNACCCVCTHFSLRPWHFLCSMNTPQSCLPRCIGSGAIHPQPHALGYGIDPWQPHALACPVYLETAFLLQPLIIMACSLPAQTK
jgi:hypothetical protein